jgi:HlyD family secretion protein
MTLQARGQAWTNFNLREDQLDGLTVGFPVELTTADGNVPIDARIDEIVPRGEFAIWRTARAVGDHDLNTFVLRADPVGPASKALQPGMSVWLKTASQTVQ